MAAPSGIAEPGRGRETGSTVHDIRSRQRQRFFDPATHRFRCPDCGVELQLSIAEILPPRLSKEDTVEYVASLMSDCANSPADVVLTAGQAATMRRGGG